MLPGCGSAQWPTTEWGGERRRTEWWRGTCDLARWLPGVDCGVVVIRWPLFIARHERRRLGVGCELVGFARDELHGAGGSRRLSRRVVGEAGEAVVGVAGAAANKRISRLFVAELSSPSGRVRLAQAFGDWSAALWRRWRRTACVRVRELDARRAWRAVDWRSSARQSWTSEGLDSGHPTRRRVVGPFGWGLVASELALLLVAAPSSSLPAPSH